VTDESLKEQSENVLRYVLTEDQEYLQARLNEIMESGSIDTTEFRLEFDDNSVLHLACDAFLIRQNTAITGFVKDITREKEHENYVIEITAQKDAFLDMITHNLSGPLTMSQNLLSWVQRSVDAGDTKMNGLLVMLHTAMY
jgi:two-component system sensor histidine kinase VicK